MMKNDENINLLNIYISISNEMFRMYGNCMFQSGQSHV